MMALWTIRSVMRYSSGEKISYKSFFIGFQKVIIPYLEGPFYTPILLFCQFFRLICFTAHAGLWAGKMEMCPYTSAYLLVCLDLGEKILTINASLW